jgi:hypothetical protein
MAGIRRVGGKKNVGDQWCPEKTEKKKFLLLQHDGSQ